ncbi:uncharacterized protein [Macrobrachium rosenbergii]|uniref:uncharacterized protein n=1 Tax=Macrobrachium rosenbergii TaxID=79674 RepID=UPI0034D5D111
MAAATETPRGPAPVGFYLRDTISGRMMLIDIGAMWSVFLPSREDCRRSPDLVASLTAANGSPILSYSTKLLSISMLGRRYRWKFIVTDVRTPLLGADFLAHFGLAVDIGCKCLLDTESCQSLPLLPSPREPTICLIAPLQYGSLLKEFPEAFKPELRQVPVAPEDIPKTAIIMPFGSYVFTFSTFGLRNAGATFQRLMDSILGDLDFCFCYGDDILIFSRSHKEHLPHIRKFCCACRRVASSSGNIFGSPGPQRSPPADDGRQQRCLWSLPGISHQRDPSAHGLLQQETQPYRVPLQHLLQGTLLLEGKSFAIWSDHQLLFHSFTKLGDAWSSRQQRHLAAIAVFTSTIKYLPSRKNPVADALSRIKINTQLGIDYEDLAREQAADPVTPAYGTAITSLKWEEVPLGPGGSTLLSDVSTGRPCPLVLASRRRLVFDIIHGLSHPSGRMTARLLTEKFVWHSTQKDSMAWQGSACSVRPAK